MPSISQPKKQNNSKRTAQQLAKQQGITVRAVQKLIALAGTQRAGPGDAGREGRLVGRPRASYLPGEARTCSPCAS